jgi:hypothetical protein
MKSACGVSMKRVTLIFGIILFSLFQLSLTAKDSDERKNIAAALLSSVETPVWNCDLPGLQKILGAWINVKDIQAIIILSDTVSCSIFHSDAMASQTDHKIQKSAKDTIQSTVIRDKVRAHLEKLNERSNKKELHEIELKIIQNENEIGVLVVYFSG